MKIEHVGYQVGEPAAMARWYEQHLGFVCKRSADEPVVVRFLADQTGTVMIEIYRNPKVGVPDYAAADPLTFHLAFVCDDVVASVARLKAAGAKLYSGPDAMPNGDLLAMMRDPWGVSIQLCKRGKGMI